MSDTNTPNDTPAQPEGPTAIDALLDDAQAFEGAGQQAQAQQQQAQAEAQADATAAELFAALEMARLMASPAFAWWPDFGQCWSDKQLHAISAAGAIVMQRHGLSMGELMGQWGPYIALAGATIPPALATHQAIKHRKEQAEAEARRERQHSAQAPANDGWHGARNADGSPAP